MRVPSIKELAGLSLVRQALGMDQGDHMKDPHIVAALEWLDDMLATVGKCREWEAQNLTDCLVECPE